MQLPPELDFLAPLFDEPTMVLRQNDWLLNDFDDNHWEYVMDTKESKHLDWNVALEDGTRLIDKQHRDLMNGLKYYLAGSTALESQLGTAAKSTRSLGFSRALHVIDFILLNSREFQLAKYGLAGLGKDSLKLIISEISSINDTAESVYGWSKRLSLFCLKLTIDTDPREIEKTLEKWPELSFVSDEQKDTNTLDIPIETIPRIRAALQVNGYYRITGKGYVPNSILISKDIYRNTIKGRFVDKPTPEIFRIYNSFDFGREYPPMPVTTGKRERMGAAIVNGYKRSLYALGNLHELGLPAPAAADLVSVKNYIPEPTTIGRFRTVPSNVIFSAVRNSIELHIKHGKKIIDAWCKVALYCKRNQISASKISDETLQEVVGEELRELGVRTVTLTHRGRTGEHSERLTKADYYQQLRSNNGLIELVRTYIGAVQLVVGALMARRVGELLDLNANDCLDAGEKWLVFFNRKSTYRIFGTRQAEARPIEPIAVLMIKNLIRMQKILKRTKCIPEIKGLFATPSAHSEVVIANISPYQYNQNLDFLCDYFETEVTQDGKRYYIRQHQLRRFFALLFFYSSSFGGLETLQWMLGHTDAKHVWHYITESLDGATLRGAKAQFVAENIHSGDIASYENLSTLLKSRYGTDNFTMVDTEELEDYLTDLMDQGSIEIEPEFIEDNEGQHFRMVVKVMELSA